MQCKYPVFVTLKTKSIKCQVKKPGNEATMPFTNSLCSYGNNTPYLRFEVSQRYSIYWYMALQS